MKVTREQKDMLRKYMPEIEELVETGDIRELELALDRVIVEKGLDKEGEITREGVMLQKIYDEIFEQNREGL